MTAHSEEVVALAAVESKDATALRQAQTKITVALITGPVSLLLGVVVLSIIGLVFACLGMRGVSALQNKTGEIANAARALKKKATVACILCAAALVLNVLSLIVLYPITMEILNSSDFNQALNSYMAQNGQGLSNSGSSVWG